MLVIYSTQVSPIIMYFHDAVATYDFFSTWTQHSIMDTGTGCVRFPSPSSLNSEHADLTMDNSMWYLGAPRWNMKTMPSSTVETVRILTSVLQYKLWIHRLGRPAEKVLILTSAARDKIINLHKHPIFQFSYWIRAKLYEHQKGHHDKNLQS